MCFGELLFMRTLRDACHKQREISLVFNPAGTYLNSGQVMIHLGGYNLSQATECMGVYVNRTFATSHMNYHVI